MEWFKSSCAVWPVQQEQCHRQGRSVTDERLPFVISSSHGLHTRLPELPKEAFPGQQSAGTNGVIPEAQADPGFWPLFNFMFIF